MQHDEKDTFGCLQAYNQSIVGKLYIVSTPIGNLEDITLRAIRILREVGLIATENINTTRKLLTHFNISAPLVSYREENRIAQIPKLLQALAMHDVALVSEAGTPGISDPGTELVRAAISAGFQVMSVPGPSAVNAAVTVSGLPTDRFLFIGFLPRRRHQRGEMLSRITQLHYTLVLFEAPHRLRESLEQMRTILGNRRAAIARELTKLHEEVFRGTLDEAYEYFREPKGEFTIVIEGASKEQAQPQSERAIEELRQLKAAGRSARDAVTTVAQAYAISRREVYRMWLNLLKERT